MQVASPAGWAVGDLKNEFFKKHDTKNDECSTTVHILTDKVKAFFEYQFCILWQASHFQKITVLKIVKYKT